MRSIEWVSTRRDKKIYREDAMTRGKVLAAAAFVALIGALPPAHAAEFPTKPITLVLGFAPGGPSDVMARILTKRMEELLKQPVVIENRAGAGGGIAANAVARAAPDGYTILLATGSSLAINVSLYKNLGYDPEKDFEPISLVGTQTNLLYTHPGSVPAKTLAEFVAYVKANPETLNDAATKKALTDLGVDLVNSSPDQLRAYIKSEIPKWAKVVNASGAKVE